MIRLARETAYRRKTPAYLVGGFVRDLILNVKNLDLDILLEGDGIKFAEEFARVLKAPLICHRRFGTATVTLGHKLKVDIASARKEFYPHPASLPVVSAGRMKDDLIRRDFTINAMAISINREDFGKLIDFFGGRKDLRSKKIRILHLLSFIDDPTRILRAVRFEQRYDFKIEPLTLGRIKEAARREILKEVQPQRIRDELILILKEPRPIKPVKRLQGLTGLGFMHTGLALSGQTAKLFAAVESQISWFKACYPRSRQLDTWLIYFLALSDAWGTAIVRDICRKFAFRRGEEKRIMDYKKIGNKLLPRLTRSNLKPAEIFHVLEPLSYEVILMLKAKFKGQGIQRRITDFFAFYNGMRICISGEDLKEMGVKPGPLYQNIFRKILDAKLNGKVKTKEEELELAGKLI